jgi:hypothetical protein
MMIKTPLVALGAIVALAFVVTQVAVFDAPVQAAAVRVAPPPPSSTPPSQPDDPNNPGNGPDLPTATPEEQKATAEEICNAALHKLKKIPVSMVVAYDNQPGVTVVPVCNSGPARKAELDSAQALPLQDAIANNVTLMTPLGDHGFKADDVVGVVLREGVATLYVHKGS